MSAMGIEHKRRVQLDKYFDGLRSRLRPQPKNGWVAEIRTLLLMTGEQLAKRVGVSQSVISNLEKSERNSTITLRSLERLASALECDFYYALVPKKGLEAELHDRAEKLYEQRRQQVAHHMKLEQQEVEEDEIKHIVRRAIEILELYPEVWERE
jgi:predicted DNA-binding mobile mystery protein A